VTCLNWILAGKIHSQVQAQSLHQVHYILHKLLEFKLTLALLMPICCICLTAVFKYLASGCHIQYIYYVAGCKTEGLRVDFQSGLRFFPSPNYSDRHWALSTSYKWATNTVSPDVKRPEFEAKHSPQTSTYLRIRVAIPLLSPYASLACARTTLLKNVSKQIILK
jgi:hypothetical protein